MNDNSFQETNNPDPKITVTRSILYKRKMAKKGHAFFVVKHKDLKNNSVATLAQEVRTEGLNPISELAVKGELVKQFREHFKI